MGFSNNNPPQKSLISLGVLSIKSALATAIIGLAGGFLCVFAIIPLFSLGSPTNDLSGVGDLPIGIGIALIGSTILLYKVLRRLLYQQGASRVRLIAACTLLGLAPVLAILYNSISYFHYGYTGVVAFLLAGGFCTGVLIPVFSLAFSHTLYRLPQPKLTKRVVIIFVIILVVLLGLRTLHWLMVRRQAAELDSGYQICDGPALCL